MQACRVLYKQATSRKNNLPKKQKSFCWKAKLFPIVAHVLACYENYELLLFVQIYWIEKKNKGYVNDQKTELC